MNASTEKPTSETVQLASDRTQADQTQNMRQEVSEKRQLVSGERGDIAYLLAAVEAHADKFPVPEHMQGLVSRIRADIA